MKTNNYNPCMECAHINTCVLTSQKEKVFSCSEFDKRREEDTMHQFPISYKEEQIKTTELEMAM
jgi:hypothetical protein